ncbi:MAG: bifunctional adenosylcobinamide kinase/adenosylcobinamide-phosphate guanylyltransferase [Rhodobacterales bacterium]|nr:MAG: bifunctional adenosylcobinamide kinase/adenosylcobinamide-phosphate guanylyltransferase [Rhodobacterales bacterium]
MTELNATHPKLTLVIGGAASGKSVFAEGLVQQSGLNKIYLATAQAHDGEMAAKIARHQQQRGTGWHTIEAPLDLTAPLNSTSAADMVLLDCATLWLTNHLLAESDLPAAQQALLDALQNCAGAVVVVSNDVGAGIVPQNALSRRFRQAQGELNQALAARADLVVHVIAGLPMLLKGDLPK